MTRPRIAVDLDGVVYDWEGTARYLLERHFGYGLDVSDSWGYLPSTVTKEHWRWLWEDGVKVHGLFRYGNLQRGAVDGLLALEKYGRLEVVTHRPRSAVQDTLRFVANLPDVFEGVHILSDGQPKSSVGADIYIDDGPHVIEDVLGAGLGVVIFDQPWNRLFVPPVSGQRSVPWRAKGWAEVPLCVDGLLDDLMRVSAWDAGYGG